MFNVGDKVFYPMHGACVLQSIEEKEILDQKQLYFIMEIHSKNLKIMLAKDKIDQSGLRKIESSETIDKVLLELNQGETDFQINHNIRYRNNLNKMKSGDIYQGSEVIRDLTRINCKKTLTPGDKKMLENAYDFLVSEIMLSVGIPEDQAALLLDKAIKN